MSWWRRLVQRREMERHLDAELRFHVDGLVADNLRAGMSEQQARRSARLQFGGVEQVKEDCRDARGTRWAETLLQDLRFALRTLPKTPGFAIAVIGTLALGIGATSVMFAALKSVLIEPLPYSNANELVVLRTDYALGLSHEDWVLWGDMQELVRDNRAFQSIGIYHYAILNLAGDQTSLPEALYGLNVSASLFPTLGVKPMLGRNILPEETQPGRDHEIILSYGLWMRRFNADRSIVGHFVRVNGRETVIIGVMPPGFDFPLHRGTTVRTPSPYMEFWTPLAVDPVEAQKKVVEGYGAVARLRKGISVAQAQDDLLRISAVLPHDYPVINNQRTLRPLSLRNRTLGFARTGLPLLMAAALMFMLIASANVANLQLARGLIREREIAVRMSLGASRARIARQLITESCMLAILGGLIGFVLAVLAWRLLPAVAPMSLPRLAAARADSGVFIFTFAIAIVSGFLFGIVPAMRTVQRDPASTLGKTGSRGAIGSLHSRLRSALVVAEIAVAVILVVIGGLVTGNFVRLMRTDVGFDADRVLASIIIPSGDQYKTSERRGVLLRRILDSVRSLPGVEFAGTVDAVPFSGENNGLTVTAGHPSEHPKDPGPLAEVNRVSADYIQAMGIRLLQGRFFNETDEKSSREVAIVSEAVASRFWPAGDALGKQICVGCREGQPLNWVQVVGITQSVHHAALDEPAGLNVYLCGDPLDVNFLVVRANGRSNDIGPVLRTAVATVDPSQPVFLSAPLSSLIADSVADRQFVMTVLAITATLALLLAAAGVYSVVSYLTSWRTQEIGVRMALGANFHDVRALVLRQAAMPVGIGISLGLATAFVVTRLLRTFVVGLVSTDPLLIGIALGAVLIAVFLACYLPARRASHINPMEALRWE